MLNGCALEGLAGTAKSHIMGLIYKYYVSIGKRIMILTYTNAAAHRFLKDGIEAKTIHKGLFIDPDSNLPKNGTLDVDIIMIDEVFMTPGDLMATILEIKRYRKLTIYTSGDHNQLEPVNDNFNAYESDIYGDLVNWTKYTLTECVRSDSQTFDICKYIVDTKQTDHMTQWLNSRKLISHTWRNLCYTNDKRLEVNKAMATMWTQHINPTHEMFTFHELSSSGPVEFKVQICPEIVVGGGFVGMPLIVTRGCSVSKLTKGSWYYLQGWNETHMFIRDTQGEITEVDKKIFAHHLTLAFCTTIHKNQGVTIDTQYILHEVDRYTWRLMYVAISRTTDLNNIYVL